MGTLIRVAIAGGIGAIVVAGGGYAYYRHAAPDQAGLTALKASAVGQLFNHDLVRAGNAHLSTGVLLCVVATGAVGFVVYRVLP